MALSSSLVQDTPVPDASRRYGASTVPCPEVKFYKIYFSWSCRLVRLRTHGSHPCNMGSNPIRTTTSKISTSGSSVQHGFDSPWGCQRILQSNLERNRTGRREASHQTQPNDRRMRASAAFGAALDTSASARVEIPRGAAKEYCKAILSGIERAEQ